MASVLSPMTKPGSTLALLELELEALHTRRPRRLSTTKSVTSRLAAAPSASLPGVAQHFDLAPSLLNRGERNSKARATSRSPASFPLGSVMAANQSRRQTLPMAEPQYGIEIAL